MSWFASISRRYQCARWIPIATSVVFGIGASTLLVLVVLPPIDAVLADLKLVR